MNRHILASLALTLGLLGMSAPLDAQELDQLLGLRIRSAVEHGKQRPAILLRPEAKLKSLEITLRAKGGKEIVLRSGPVDRGHDKAIEFDQPVGTHHYDTALRGKWAKGGEDFGFTFAFEATSQPPLEVTLHKKDVDLERRQMRLAFSRPVHKVWYEVKGDGARLLDTREFSPAEGGSRHLDLRWRSDDDVVVERISVKGWDQMGFWAGVEVTPFFISIEHQELEFEFGKADILPGAEPKLRATLAELRAALDKHGKEIEIQLYIAGYTDTVGSPQANRELSERRARAIAVWFQAQGIPVPIFYQGFGEEVLAVATPDDTPESRNRRAIYVLSAGPPASSPVVPRDDWQPLKK